MRLQKTQYGVKHRRVIQPGAEIGNGKPSQREQPLGACIIAERPRKGPQA